MNLRDLIAAFCLCLGAGSAGAENLSVPGVRIDRSHVSLNGQAVTLTDVLSALGCNAITVNFHGDPSQVPVADAFENLEVTRALGRMLSAYSHILIDHGPVAGQRQIDVIMLGATDTAPRRFEAQPAEPHAASADAADVSAETLVSRAVSGEAELRANAAEALAYRHDEANGAPAYGDQVLLQMLSDPDESVRARALETIKDTADETPLEALTQVAREDSSTERRIQALELLVERSEKGESHEPLRIALNDPEPAVRRRARELALDWHIPLNAIHRPAH